MNRSGEYAGCGKDCSSVSSLQRRVPKALYFLLMPAAWSRNVLKNASSLGTQRSSTKPDHPPTDMASFGIKVQTLVSLCQGRVYITGSASVMSTCSRFGLGRL